MIDADEVIAFVCTATGWTWDYTHAQLDIPRLLSLNKAWRRHPPAHVAIHHVLVALGAVKPEPAPPPSPPPAAATTWASWPASSPSCGPKGWIAPA